MGYVIGSFNLRDFNLQAKTRDCKLVSEQGTKEVSRKFEKIADIIIGEKFDVVAIQEANAEIAIKHLTTLLNRRKNMLMEWDYRFDTPRAPRSARHNVTSRYKDVEGYAFIWNIKRLSLLEVKNKDNPRIINQYKIKDVIGQTDLLRDPYFIRLTAKGIYGGSFFEIRLVNTHIRYAKSSLDNFCMDSPKQMRINEFKMLVEDVLTHCTDLRTGENMPAYTFLLGDYNLCLSNSITGIREETKVAAKGYNRTFKTVQEKATSLKKPCEREDIRDENEDEDDNLVMLLEEDYYANNYDHFTYEAKYEKQIQLNSSRVDAVDIYYRQENNSQTRLKMYRAEISDHVPIKMNMDFI